MIPARVLRQLGFASYAADKRNRVALCRDDHAAHENLSRPLPRVLLPIGVFVFAAELGLTWYLDRHYPRAVAA